MGVLDQRVSKKPQTAGLVAKKVRKIGTFSDSEPPVDAPTWALAKDTGKFSYKFVGILKFFKVVVVVVYCKQQKKRDP